MSGSDFEDVMIGAIRDWAGENGVVMFQNQSFSVRGGDLQLAQRADILVDSPEQDFYLGFEVKTRDTENSPGMYFSKINPQQFHKQLQYEAASGRHLYVIFELRNRDGINSAYLVPLPLFTQADNYGCPKVSWEMIEEFGVFIGEDGEYTITDEAFEKVHHLRKAVEAASPDELKLK